MEFLNAWGGGIKISMPPVVGVLIFSGTTQSEPQCSYKVCSYLQKRCKPFTDVALKDLKNPKVETGAKYIP